MAPRPFKSESRILISRVSFVGASEDRSGFDVGGSGGKKIKYKRENRVRGGAFF